MTATIAHPIGTPTGHPPTETRARPRSVGVLIAALTVVVVASCSSNSGSTSVASVESAPITAAGPATSSSVAAGETYSSCMRANGVPNFPDADSTGNVVVGSDVGLDVNSPAFTAAQEACKSLAQAGSSGTQDAASAEQLKFAQCMRSNGIADFPDPQPGGGIMLGGDGGIDPTAPAFQAAQTACKQFLPGGGGGPAAGGSNP